MNPGHYNPPPAAPKVTLKIFSWKPNGTATVSINGDNINTFLKEFESVDDPRGLTAVQQATNYADNVDIVLRSVGIYVTIETRNGL